jgi:hypothetical protein
MSGIFSRKIYDNCYQSNRLNQGILPGSYKINVEQVKNNSSCIANNGTSNFRGIWYGPNEINSISALSDIESHLKNLDLPDSRCLEGRTLAEKNAHANFLAKELKNKQGICSRNLEPVNTRLEASVLDVKMLPQTRFDFPIRDPRVFVYYGFNSDKPGSEQVGSNRFGINTRLQAKDMSPNLYHKKLYNVKN